MQTMLDEQIKLTEFNGKKYQVLHGTYYHEDTKPEMVHLLEEIRLSHRRVRFHWGDTKTGLDWGDVYDVAGTLGRSSGSVKVPLLIQTSRSLGGGAILDNCIVKITTTTGVKTALYLHPNYHEKGGNENA